MDQILGQGMTSTVYFGTYNQKDAAGKKTKQNVAVKVIKSNLMTDPNFTALLTKELEVLQRLRHPNIVEFYGVEKTANSIYLIFQLCSGGDLKTYLKNNGPLPECKA